MIGTIMGVGIAIIAFGFVGCLGVFAYLIGKDDVK